MRRTTLLAAALTLAACAGPEPIPAGDRFVVWCYRTLADPECYPSPDATRETGFIGSFALKTDAFWLR